MDRRVFLTSAVASPLAVGGQAAAQPVAAKPGVHVPAGKDRETPVIGKIWGLIPLAVKVSTADSGGGLFLFEHPDMGKGGPPRHVHHEQDEWFYVTKGEFLFEVGDKQLRAKPGDSLFVPRTVPHTFACVSDPGTLLAALTPAGTFEAFIRATTKQPRPPAPEELAKTFAAHGMTIVGPPLKVD
ncbi:MAG: cupin domain-containing protein [Gemmataceae bacterium]